MYEQYPIRFFFGANTPKGFLGYHKTDLYDPRGGWRAYTIKSGAGTGKSTLLRTVWQEMLAQGFEGEAIFCSSDPDSLDAVVFPEVKLCVVDATAPHILEPIAYGECEQLVPLGCCLRADVLEEQKDTWFTESDACAAGHARCCRFLSAAAGILENNIRLQETALEEEKLLHTIERLAQREFGTAHDRQGRETRRFLSAVTPVGPVLFSDSAAALCPRLFVIEDEYGAVSARCLAQLRRAALAAGLDVISCACPLFPQTKLEHLLIPSIGVGFLTSNSRHKMDFPVYRRIHAARFIDASVLKSKKQQLSFNRRAAAELLLEASHAAQEAKKHHDCMEAIHISAMDWELWQQIADLTIADCLKTAQRRRG